MKINEKIRFMRQLKEFSQEDMAERLGLSLNGYSNIERGETDVQISRLEQIADILKVDLLELLSFGEKTVACFLGNSNSNYQFSSVEQKTTDAKQAQFEIEKLQLIIEQQRMEIAYLKEILALKNQKATQD